MFYPSALSRYIAISYLKYFGLVLLIATMGLLLSNAFDTLNRFRSTVFTMSLFANLVTLKLPYLLIEIIPLIVFISCLLFFYSLTKSNELISIFNTGTSIWKILTPVIASAIIIGAISTCVVQPIGSILISKYETIEAKLLKKRSLQATISSSGVMIAEEYGHQRRIIVARSVNTTSKELGGLTILFTDHDNNFISRIDAESASLDNEEFLIRNLLSFDANTPAKHDAMIIPTSLSIERFIQGFVSPQHISFWDLHAMIAKLQAAGVPTARYQLYYYKQLFKPLMMMAVCFMATCFTDMRHSRTSGARAITLGLAIGFAVYLGSEIFIALLIRGGLGSAVSTLFPISAITLLSVFVILHLHEAA